MKKLLTAAVVLGVLAAGLTANAQWIGDTSQDYNDPLNWTGDAFPTGDVLINTNTAGVFPILSSDAAFTPVDIRIGAAGDGRLDHTAGSLATGAGNWMFVGYLGHTAIYNLADTTGSGGTFTGFDQGSGSLIVGSGNGNLHVALDDGTTSTVNMNTTGALNAGYLEIAGNGSGTGTFNLDNGTVNISGASSIGHGGDNTRTQQGTLNMSGGTWNNEGDLTIGFAGSASANGIINMSGGTLNVGSTIQRWMMVGQWDPVNATLIVSNGATLNLNAGSDLRTGNGDNQSGTRLIDVNGGQIIGTGAANGGPTYVALNAGGGSGTDTVNIRNGGLVAAEMLTGGNANTVVNFDGGTLRALTNSTDFLNVDSAGMINILQGGATFDSAGFDVTVNNALLDGDGLGGGMTKTGDGTLTLLNPNSTYVGDTTVEAGELVLADSGFLMFVVEAADFNNKLTGAGTATIDGTFLFDLTGASTTLNDSWTIADVASSSFGGTFTAASTKGAFSDMGGGLWNIDENGTTYQFDTSSGNLMVIPEPATIGLIVLAGTTMLVIRRKFKW